MSDVEVLKSDAFGRVDAVVNNAGVANFGRIEDTA